MEKDIKLLEAELKTLKEKGVKTEIIRSYERKISFLKQNKPVKK